MSVQKPVLTTGMEMPDKGACSSSPSCGKKNDSCKKRDNPAKDKTGHEKCCDLGICNPFGACCSYVLADKYNLQLTCTLPVCQKQKSANENGLSSCIREVWNPPKILAVV